MRVELKLSSDEFQTAVRDVERFNGTPEHKMKPFVALDSSPTFEYALTRLLGQAFGYQLHCVTRAENGVGVTDGCAGFLSELPEDDSNYRPLWVAGHEMCHMLQMNKPSQWNEALEKMKKFLVDDAYEWRRKIEDNDVGATFARITGRPFTQEKALEETVWNEVLADVYGNMWIDVEFWQMLLERGGDGNGVLFNIVIDYLQKIKHKYFRNRMCNIPAARQLMLDMTLMFLWPDQAQTLTFENVEE